MNKIEKLEAIKIMFPDATIWSINEDGSINLDKAENEFNNIRLFCCANIFHGNINNFNKLNTCAIILGANNYLIKPQSDHNDWIELYYRLSKKEILENNRKLKLKELEEIDNKIKNLK